MGPIARLQKSKELEELERAAESEEISLVNLESKLQSSENYQRSQKFWMGSIYLGVHNVPLDKKPEAHYVVGLGIERKLVSQFSISLNGAYLTDAKGDKPSSSGTPNSTKDFLQPSSVTEFNIGAAYRISNLKFSLVYGLQNYKRETQTYSYGPIGVKNGETSSAISGSRSFYGLGAKYSFESSWELDIVGKKYDGIDDLGFGLSFGFHF